MRDRVTEAAMQRFVDPSGRCNDWRLLNAVAAYFGLTLASEAEMDDVVALARKLVPAATVTAAGYIAMQRRTHASVYVLREQAKIVGILAGFALSEAGVDALEANRFDSVDIDPTHVAGVGEPTFGGYAWGFGAVHDEAARQVVRGSFALSMGLKWALPSYARVATDAGERVSTGRMGYEWLHQESRLVVRRPRSRPFEGYHFESAA